MLMTPEGTLKKPCFGSWFGGSDSTPRITAHGGCVKRRISTSSHSGHAMLLGDVPIGLWHRAWRIGG